MYESHTFFVWASYGLFLAVLIWQAGQPILRRRRVIERLHEEWSAQGGQHDTDT